MSDAIITEVEGQKVKLTNLDKLLFPDSGIIKAEVIQYYKQVAPRILKYIGNRPLTLIRYPDGIDGKKFYSKNMPDWAPKWVDYAKIIDDDNRYVLANKAATMVWLGNLAAIEIHPMQTKGPEFLFPDHMIFDLDPSPKFKFEDLKDIANSLKSFLEKKGFLPFIKTSGSKGLHIYVPIFPRYDHQTFYNEVKQLASEFVALHPKVCTLRMSKEKRLGKVLVDIYRNHRSNTCAAPYSLRARPFAPISMPFLWKELNDIKDSQQFKLQDFTLDQDAWEGFRASEMGFPTSRSTQVAIGDLSSYEEKRNFQKTKEPLPKVVIGNNDQFVVQLHDASNLHYDLRLEFNGSLMSWAIPKALPRHLEEKRMAIRTEDHPVKYLDFEGVIPKNEYGGGQMWIMDRGTYTLIEKTEKKIKFKLHGKHLKGEYNLVNTRKEQWLITTKSKQSEVPQFTPMLAGVSEEIPNGSNLGYEVKWDGLRALLYIDQGKVTIISRSGSDLTEKFPELTQNLSVEAQSAVLDGEIVVLDDKGVSNFSKVVSRLHSQKKAKQFAVFYAFDLLYLDGRQTIDESFQKRHDWLYTIIDKGERIRVSELFKDGKALFEAGRKMGIEGIMAKRLDAKYFPGSRSEVWQKIKYRSEIIAYIIGYTRGEGGRVDAFGALHLGIFEDDKLKYIGKVGSGFDTESLLRLRMELDKLPKSIKLIDETVDQPQNSYWVQPVLKCRVRFASWTNSETLREPVFIELIKDEE